MCVCMSVCVLGNFPLPPSPFPNNDNKQAKYSRKAIDKNNRQERFKQIYKMARRLLNMCVYTHSKTSVCTQAHIQNDMRLHVHTFKKILAIVFFNLLD